MKVHPNTGERSIFVARHAFGVCHTDDPAVRLPREESRELLQRLLVNAVADESSVYVHEWEIGDTMVWDNRRLLHRAFPYDYSEPRVLIGTRVEGDHDCVADNVSGWTAGELSIEASPEFPFGQCGKQVLAEELAIQRQEVAQGVPRMLAETLPATIQPGSSALQIHTQARTPVPALSPAQQRALEAHLRQPKL